MIMASAKYSLNWRESSYFS